MTSQYLRTFTFVTALSVLALTSCNNAADPTPQDTDTTASQSDTTLPPAAAPATMAATAAGGIDGNWELTYISGPRIAFDGLYPDKKPQLNFSVIEGKVSGFSGCNRLNGPVKIDSSQILFSDLITTKMACPGQGETVFLNTLKKINRFSVSGDSVLHLIMGDIALMNFKRIKE